MNFPDRIESDAFDALIILAFLQELPDASTLLNDSSAQLDPEDERALNALGSDLASRVMAGEKVPVTLPKPTALHPEELELSSAMNRGGEEGELTQKAQEEIERKIDECDMES